MPVDDANGGRGEIVVILDGVISTSTKSPGCRVGGDARHAIDVIRLPRRARLRATAVVGASIDEHRARVTQRGPRIARP